MALHDDFRNTDKNVLGERLHQMKDLKNECPMFQQWLLRQYETLCWGDPRTLLERISQTASDGFYKHISNACVMKG